MLRYQYRPAVRHADTINVDVYFVFVKSRPDSFRHGSLSSIWTLIDPEFLSAAAVSALSASSSLNR